MVVNQEHPSVVALQQALAVAGSQVALARIAGVSQQAVSKWFRRRKPIPGEYVLKVEAETGVSRHDLRPDLYPREAGQIEGLRA